MEFINKCNQILFFPYYLSFENLKWDIISMQYIDYTYSKFSPTKQIIRNLLIDEQKEKCCYCLKILEKNNSTTLEHIYPQNPNASSSLATYSIMCIDNRVFDYSVQNIPSSNLDNLPHDISYYNLLACCSKCNGERGNKDIIPFIFDSIVKTKFLYDDQGNIFSSQYFNEIVSIGLAGDYYKRNRKIWRQLKNNVGNNPIPTDINTLKNEIRTIASALYLVESDPYYLDLITDEDKVKDTIKYKYFFDN
ncbi:MAG: hypothetical protein P0Y62_05330 [Candidatus Chryseobacterium colombiense]|nr:hypothetical protein [Chryseobacterium sp.]WEK70978.1 MAG: hypothetical protein P0Y62_05330 [Chryseobacterium sp.]